MKVKVLPELLAPAGGPKQLEAALENGADAVYLGGKSFNARQNAENFSDEELKTAIEYAHLKGVNIYVTLNTLIDDCEMQKALEHAHMVYEAGADALIVQDIGFISEVRRLLPDLPLHFSTQSTIYNLDGVNASKLMGAKRVVLARELSLKEINEITVKTDMEIEVFVHGALCMGYSGQCLLSSMIGGRSGNRGRCAQPCRLPYELLQKFSGSTKTIEEKGYLLSPKDLCTVEHLDKLIEAGVHSLKIEGRMKSPEYVAVVTSTYRKYLDLYTEIGASYKAQHMDLHNLKQVYNRGGFTTGYFFENQGEKLITRGRAKHWGTYLGKVIGQNPVKKYIDILLDDNLSMGDGIEIVNQGLPGNIVTWMQKNGDKINKGYSGETVTVGYINGSVRKGDLVYKISDKELNHRASVSLLNDGERKVPIFAELTVKKHESIKLKLTDDRNNMAESFGGFVPEPAKNKPLTEEIAKLQVEKTGGTPFYVKEFSAIIEEGLMVPLSELNAVRREAIDNLSTLRINKYPHRQAVSVGPLKSTDGGHHSKTAFASHLKSVGGCRSKIEPPDISKPGFSVFFYDWPDYTEGRYLNADRVYLPILSRYGEEKKDLIKTLKDCGTQVFITIPPITKGYYDDLVKEQGGQFENIGFHGILIGNLSHLELKNLSRLPLIGDYSLNIFNSSSVKAASDMKIQGVTLSPELTLKQMQSVMNCDLQLEVTVYGRIPVMISEHCFIGSSKNSKEKSNAVGKDVRGNCTAHMKCHRESFYIKDRVGAEFPVIGDPLTCRTTVLNKDIMDCSEYIEPLMLAGISYFRLYAFDETPKEIGEIIKKWRGLYGNL